MNENDPENDPWADTAMTALPPISADNPLCDDECGAQFEEISYAMAHLLDHFEARGASREVAVSELEVHLKGWLDASREDDLR